MAITTSMQLPPPVSDFYWHNLIHGNGPINSYFELRNLLSEKPKIGTRRFYCGFSLSTKLGPVTMDAKESALNIAITQLREDSKYHIAHCDWCRLAPKIDTPCKKCKEPAGKNWAMRRRVYTIPYKCMDCWQEDEAYLYSNQGDSHGRKKESKDSTRPSNHSAIRRERTYSITPGKVPTPL